jgi:hypothetical protein
LAPRIVTAQAVVPDAMAIEATVATAGPAAAAAVEAVAVPGPAVRQPGLVGTTMRLCGGLAVSLAYVMFLPFIGFAVLLGAGGKALAQKFAAKGV